ASPARGAADRLMGQLRDDAGRDRDDHAQPDGIDQHGEEDKNQCGAAGHRAFARWRSTNFWILPVEVLGNSVNMTVRGILNLANRSRAKARISLSSVAAPGFSSTKAQGCSPHLGSGLATTATNNTSGCLAMASSTSMEEI